MVAKFRKFLSLRQSLKELETAESLASGQINSIVSQIDDIGVQKRYFWRHLADTIDEKAQTGRMKHLEVGETIDLAYRVEMHESQPEGIGTIATKAKYSSRAKQF